MGPSSPLARKLFPLLTTFLLVSCPHAPAQTIAMTSPPQPRALPAEEAGDLLMARQQYVEAIEAYRLAPYDPDTLNKTGVAWHHLSAIGEARKNYELALAMRPDFPDAINNLAAADFAEKKYGDAIHLYHRALELAPGSPLFLVNLGTAWFAEGKSSRGMDAYRAALSIDPDVFDLDSPRIVNGPITDRERAQQDYCIAELFAETNHPDRALEYLRKAFGAGFRDYRRLLHDQAFATLKQTADFAALAGEMRLQ